MDDAAGATNEPDVTSWWTSGRYFVGPADLPDQFELHRMVGGGAEAEVWQAVARPSGADPTGVTVAIKMFHESMEPDPDWQQRVETLSLVQHPGLARVHKAFTGAPPHPAGGARSDGTPPRCYVVMEFVGGPSLQEWLGDHPDAPLSRRLATLTNVASALGALHRGSHGVPPVAHGDVKPDNIRLRGMDAADGAQLVDFGLMHIQGASRPHRTGATRCYAAPELFDDQCPHSAPGRAPRLAPWPACCRGRHDDRP